MAGGVDALTERARAHVEAGEPVRALHFTDLALGVENDHRAAREVKIAAMQMLLDDWDGDAFDEARLLELELRRERARVPSSGGPARQLDSQPAVHHP